MAPGVAYEARGYKQAGRTDGQADGPNRARFWLVIINGYGSCVT